MNFRFNLSKATEAACLFLERGGGQMNIMKLVKLMYLLDRLSLDRRNSPICGGDYLSMRNGPVTSEVLDLINAGRLMGETDQRWEHCVSNRTNHDVKLEKMPAREHLSDAEVSLLDAIWADHGGRDQWQLVDWCHDHCKEWVPVTNGCAPIAVEQVGIALGKSPEQINRLRQEAIELNQLDEIFARRMIRLGTALKSQEPPFHRCPVISDPQTNGGQVVLVRITTDDGTWPDGDCILKPADWNELEHDSTVAYSTCKFGPAVMALEAAIQRGLFQEISSPSAAILGKVIAAAHASAGMPPKAKKLLGRI